MAKAKQSTLRSYKQDINWDTHEQMPFSQGHAINAVLKRYPSLNRSVIRYGWGQDRHRSIIGFETNRQYLFWKDLGGELEFKGILDKTGTN